MALMSSMVKAPFTRPDIHQDGLQKKWAVSSAKVRTCIFGSTQFSRHGRGASILVPFLWRGIHEEQDASCIHHPWPLESDGKQAK